MEPAPPAQVTGGEAEYMIDPTQPLAAGQVIGLDAPGGVNGLLDSLPEPTRSMTVAGIAPAPYGGQFPAHNNAALINLRMRVISGRFGGRDISPVINLPGQGGDPTVTQDSLAAEFVLDSVQVIGASPARFVRVRLRFGTLAPAYDPAMVSPPNATQLATAPKGAFSFCPTVRFADRTLKTDPGCAHQIFGGLTLNATVHGPTGIGATLVPQENTPFFTYGPVEVAVIDANGTVVGTPSRNNVGHIMLVSQSRNLTPGPGFLTFDRLDVTARPINEVFIQITPGLPVMPGQPLPAASRNDAFGVTGTLLPTGPFFVAQIFAPGANMNPRNLVNAGIRQVRRTGTAAPVGPNPFIAGHHH